MELVHRMQILSGILPTLGIQIMMFPSVEDSYYKLNYSWLII